MGPRDAATRPEARRANTPRAAPAVRARWRAPPRGGSRRGGRDATAPAQRRSSWRHKSVAWCPARQARFTGGGKMKNTHRRLAALLIPAFLAVAATLPAIAQDKKAAEKAADKGKVRATKVLVDNDRVRVSESVFKPGEVNPLQKRGYRVTRILKGNTTVERTTDGKMERLEYKEGDVFVAPAGMSTLKNVGKSEVTIYTV